MIVCRSLRLRLLYLTTVPLLIILSVIGWFSYFSAKHEAEEIYDAQLAHFAKVLALFGQDKLEGNIAQTVIRLSQGYDTPYEKDLAYRVWLGDALMLESDNSAAFGPPTQAIGFTDRAIGGNLWRFYVLRKDNIIVEAAEDYHARQDLIEKIALSILLPFFFIFPLLIVLTGFAVKFGIAPLKALSEQIGKQEPDALKPLAIPNVPKEVSPLIDTINHLIGRVDAVIEREKRFTAYAAHELRTPLAVLKTQVQVALRSKNPAEQQEMFREVVPGIDRMTHLMEQLLTLVRAQKTGQLVEPVNLSAIAENAGNGFKQAMAEKALQFEMRITPAVILQGNGDMLHILLRNLLDNAVRYTPNGGKITLSLAKEEAHAVINVVNTGTMLSQKQLERIFEPFRRGANPNIPGSGLGLAIVKWIATAHNGTAFGESLNNEVRMIVTLS